MNRSLGQWVLLILCLTMAACGNFSTSISESPTPGDEATETWRHVEGDYVGFQTPPSWTPEEREPFGGAILEEWHLGIPDVESDQGLGFSAVSFDQLRPDDVVSEIEITLGGKAGVKWLREGENYVSYDYYTAGYNDQGSFGIHVTVPQQNDDLERQLDQVAQSVIFK